MENLLRNKATYCLKYIELKSGYSDDGSAWIGKVMTSRTENTVYFNNKALTVFRGFAVWQSRRRKQQTAYTFAMIVG